MSGRWGRGLLFAGSLALALLGQYYFAKKPDFFWDGVALYALAVALFLALVRRPRASAVRVEGQPTQLTWPMIARGAAVGLGLLLALAVLAQLNTPRDNHWPVFWLWVVAILLYLSAFVRRPAWTREGFLAALRTNGWEWGILLVLVLAALLLRAWRIDSIPWTLGGDEGSQGLWARDVLEGRLTNMFVTGWLSVPTMSFFWQAGWLRLLGDNLVGLRMPWAIVGALTVLGTYLLVRRLFDRGLALLTAFLLATYHYHIHYSRLGSNQVADPLFVVWALYFLVLGFDSSAAAPGAPGRRRRWAWAASGIVTGLAFYFYAGARQVPIILIAVMAWAALTRPKLLQEHGRDLLAMLGAFAVTVGPMALFFLKYPNDFNARLNMVGIFQSGWLEREVQITGRTQAALLAEQFRKAFFAFVYFRDRVAWYGASIPLLDSLASVFFVLGAAFSVSRLRKWPYATFVIWFVLVVTLGGALTENPPSSQRLVSSAVPAMFFAAVALRELTRGLRSLTDLPEMGRQAVLGALALFLALISLRYYFGTYQQSWTYGSFNGEVATRIGYELRDLGPGWQEYFFGAPRMYADFGSTPFIAKGVTLYDVREPLNGPPDFVNPNRSAAFIFLPERLGELQWIQQAYPDGILEEVHRIDDPDGPLLYVAYKVERP